MLSIPTKCGNSYGGDRSCDARNIAVGVVAFHFVSPLIIIIALLGIPTLVQRFRDSSNPYYTSVPMRGRIAMGAAWLALVIYLGVMSLQADTLLGFFNGR